MPRPSKPKAKGLARRRPARKVLLQQPEELATVEQVAAGGEGFARLASGLACFIPGGLPGDEVLVHELADHKSYGRATRMTVVRPSSERVVSPCAHSVECGGCDWIEWSYAAQLQGKLDILFAALTRVGRLSVKREELAIEPSPMDLNYRSRARLRVSKALDLCFVKKHSATLVPIEQCAVLSPPMQAAVQASKRWVAQHPSEFDGTEELEVRALGPRPSVRVLRRGAARRRAPQPDDAELAVSDGSAADFEELPLLDGKFTVPIGGFSQVNWAINERLVTHLLEGAANRGLSSFADLYCGAGNFALPLLRAGLAGQGVDFAGPAVKALERASQAQGGKTNSFIAGDVAEVAGAWVAAGKRFDLVIADPPRSGLGAAAPWIADLAASTIFLCACDPVTFARDLQALTSRGFEVESVRAWDMFPQTHHFESSAWLRRTV